MWSLYLRQLERRPILTQSLAAGVLFAAGDVCSQQIVERKGWQHEWYRTLRLAAYGTIIVGPMLSIWYRVMDRHIRHPNASLQALLRVTADQTLIAPAFLSIFYIVNSLGEGKSWSQAKQVWSEKFVPTLINNYKIWPAVNFINFYYVPLQHRLLVVNLVSLVWNTYLAFMLAEPSKEILFADNLIANK